MSTFSASTSELKALIEQEVRQQLKLASGQLDQTIREKEKAFQQNGTLNSSQPNLKAKKEKDGKKMNWDGWNICFIVNKSSLCTYSTMVICICTLDIHFWSRHFKWKNASYQTEKLNEWGMVISQSVRGFPLDECLHARRDYAHKHSTYDKCFAQVLQYRCVILEYL